MAPVVLSSVIVSAVLGMVNVIAAFMLGRVGKKQDAHNKQHEALEKRLAILEKDYLTESKFRQIIRDELRGFELQLMKERRLNEPR